MLRYRIQKSSRLRGKIRVPGDKSISHRALIFAALAEGKSLLTGVGNGADNKHTLNAFRAMGVQSTALGADMWEVQGVGLRGLQMAQDAIDCGNSGSTMRMLAGLLVGQEFGTRLVGDASLNKRPMRRVVEPLRARGGMIGGRALDDNEIGSPINIAPLLSTEKLRPLEYSAAVSSAQVKTALLLSGLYAEGITAYAEPLVSRDHTEKMMHALGIPLQTMSGTMVLDPSEWNQRIEPVEWEIPGDFSSAAMMLTAAAITQDSEVVVTTGLNPTRTGFLTLLEAMGAVMRVEHHAELASNEQSGIVHLRSSPLAGTHLGGELLVRSIDEMPCWCVLAATAKGSSHLRDGFELRTKESDRIAALAEVLRAFSVDVVEYQDGLTIFGSETVVGAHVSSFGDHRVAMAAVLLGLRAEGETIVDDTACIDTSFPGFVDRLRALGARIEVEEVA